MVLNASITELICSNPAIVQIEASKFSLTDRTLGLHTIPQRHDIFDLYSFITTLPMTWSVPWTLRGALFPFMRSEAHLDSTPGADGATEFPGTLHHRESVCSPRSQPGACPVSQHNDVARPRDRAHSVPLALSYR